MGQKIYMPNVFLFSKNNFENSKRGFVTENWIFF
jgi:hypothetical protein